MQFPIGAEEKQIFSRERNLELLERENFDLVIIGGGITGAGILREASLRGLKVALVEAKDFASGTSSKSSKLLHGGLRYMAYGHFKLMREALKERSLHQNFLSPHLSKSTKFIFPVYAHSPQALALIASGVFFYNALSSFKGGSRFYSKKMLQKKEPSLLKDALKGAMGYQDVIMDDARICLENIWSAMRRGAVAINYAALKAFTKNSKKKITGIYIEDKNPHSSKKTEILVKGKIVINCSGPWVDKIRKLDNSKASPLLDLSKGIHILLPKAKSENAFVLQAKKDNRIFFSIPWYGQNLVGTTDTKYKAAKDGTLEKLKIQQNEIDYLLENFNKVFPEEHKDSSQIQSAFVGLRPLIKDSRMISSSKLSREYRIVEESSGLISIVGGKYTTYRSLAEKVLKKALQSLKRDHSFSQKKEKKIYSSSSIPLVDMLPGKLEEQKREIQEYTQILGEKTISHLLSRYGPRALEVIRLAIKDPSLRKPIFLGELEILAECSYAIKKEMALHIDDFLRRRTMLTLKAPLEKYIKELECLSSHFPSKDSISLEEVKAWKHK